MDKFSMEDMQRRFGEGLPKPYESPLEAEFAHELRKHLDRDVILTNQDEVSTRWGRFRMDFLVVKQERRIVFECDGEEYHRQLRDEFRDAILLGIEAVDCIYRLRGRDVLRHLEDYLFLTAEYDAGIFSHRGLINLKNIASTQVANAQRRLNRNHFFVFYPSEDPVYNSGEDSLLFDRRLINESNDTWSDFVREKFGFAQKYQGVGIDDLVQLWTNHRQDMWKGERD